MVSIAELGSLRAVYDAGAIRYAFIDAGGEVLDRIGTPAAG
ncbi:MAG: hypothetical protein ACKOGE_03395 [Actinomycetota bacterium]